MDSRQIADELETEIARLQRALDALRPEPPKRGPGRPKKQKGKTPPWQPSDELRERVKAFVDAHPDGVTVQETKEGTGVSKTGADRTLRVLHQAEEIRHAGRKPGTRSILYKPWQVRGAMNGGS